MQIISHLKNKNVVIAASIGGVLGLIAGGKGEGSLVFSVLFGLIVGTFVGVYGSSGAKEESSSQEQEGDKPK